MSGHSKWSNIKHKKGAADNRRGRIFTKLIREIMIAAKIGGGNADGNARLRLAIEKAKAQSVPRDNIDRAVKKGSGDLGGDTIEEISYEGYGPGGVAILIDCTTDNKTRTVAELRNIFSKKGGHLGESGSVAWMFDRKGVMRIAPGTITEEDLFEKALDAGADDIKNEDDELVVLTSYEDFHRVHEKLNDLNLSIRTSGVEMIPKNTVTVENPIEAEKLMTLIDTLEDDDDVQHVWANFDIDDAVLDKIAG